MLNQMMLNQKRPFILVTIFLIIILSFVLFKDQLPNLSYDKPAAKSQQPQSQSSSIAIEKLPPQQELEDNKEPAECETESKKSIIDNEEENASIKVFVDQDRVENGVLIYSLKPNQGRSDDLSKPPLHLKITFDPSTSSLVEITVELGNSNQKDSIKSWQVILTNVDLSQDHTFKLCWQNFEPKASLDGYNINSLRAK